MLNVLILDDDQNMLNLISLMFDKYFPDTKKTMVCKTDKALKLAKKNHYDFVISDFILDENNGEEVMNKLCTDNTYGLGVTGSGENIENSQFIWLRKDVANFTSDLRRELTKQLSFVRMIKKLNSATEAINGRTNGS
jgi:CheY-like chemotaxis protein